MRQLGQLSTPEKALQMDGCGPVAGQPMTVAKRAEVGLMSVAQRRKLVQGGLYARSVQPPPRRRLDRLYAGPRRADGLEQLQNHGQSPARGRGPFENSEWGW
jgi:hypothetical protein